MYQWLLASLLNRLAFRGISTTGTVASRCAGLLYAYYVQYYKPTLNLSQVPGTVYRITNLFGNQIASTRILVVVSWTVTRYYRKSWDVQDLPQCTHSISFAYRVGLLCHEVSKQVSLKTDTFHRKMLYTRCTNLNDSMEDNGNMLLAAAIHTCNAAKPSSS
jgi:hypothetical protein